jgi:hypothetical protein
MFRTAVLCFLLSVLSTISLAGPTSLVKRGSLLPNVNPAVISLSPQGGGTYPRLTTLSDGSILSVFTFFQGSTRILTVTKSTDGGQTFGAWGTVASQTNDCDNPNIIELPDGSLIATFRNHDLNSSGVYTFYRITACKSTDGGRTWAFISQVNQRAAEGVNGLWVRVFRADDKFDGLTILIRNLSIASRRMDHFKFTMLVRMRQMIKIS